MPLPAVPQVALAVAAYFLENVLLPPSLQALTASIADEAGAVTRGVTVPSWLGSLREIRCVSAGSCGTVSK